MKTEIVKPRKMKMQRARWMMKRRWTRLDRSRPPPKCGQALSNALLPGLTFPPAKISDRTSGQAYENALFNEVKQRPESFQNVKNLDFVGVLQYLLTRHAITTLKSLLDSLLETSEFRHSEDLHLELLRNPAKQDLGHVFEVLYVKMLEDNEDSVWGDAKRRHNFAALISVVEAYVKNAQLVGTREHKWVQQYWWDFERVTGKAKGQGAGFHDIVAIEAILACQLYSVQGNERFSNSTIARVKKLSDNVAKARPFYEIAKELGGTGIFLLLPKICVTK